MKLPEKIKGKNKIRDAAIVNDFKFFDLDFLELSEKYKLTERRIQQILATNHAFIKRDKDWEKEKRINRLQRRLKTAKPTTKDELEILAEIRKELEGDKLDLNINKTERLVIVRYGEDSTEKVARPVRFQQEEVSRPVLRLGNGEDVGLNLASNVVQRANTE